MNPAGEWLEADGLGGFASGCADGIRRRRYHALLLAATTPPTGRFALVNGVEAWIKTPAGVHALSSHHYAPDVIHPDGSRRIVGFESEPWPRWIYRLETGLTVGAELFVPRGMPAVMMTWKLVDRAQEVRLFVRPLLSGRDYHGNHHENPVFRFEPEVRGEALVWSPYPGVPSFGAFTNGVYTHEPLWYRNFLYGEERARGLYFTEDLASPGVFTFDLSAGEAVLIWSTEETVPHPGSLRESERRRRAALPTPTSRAEEMYIARRGGGRTIIAGYPWFTDWGRDTFISIRGLCLSTGRHEIARDILLEWAGTVSEGMLPNRFPDHGEAPEYNSVDASLWYVLAVHEFLKAAEVSKKDAAELKKAVEAILEGYRKGTRFGIVMDENGLLRCGMPGSNLTWMDACVDGRPVTPRVGKPVEIQALWLQALSQSGGTWKNIFAQGRKNFRWRFWYAPGGHLFDVVNVDHESGKDDSSFRPNQIFAVSLLEPEKARRVVDAVEARLLTPLGLRTLAPGEPGYVGRYESGPFDRDRAYHQGTVWPWLMGPFIEAWVSVRGGTPEAKREARVRFLEPFLAHSVGGHLPEIADGDPPHTPRGCPFQAWSLAEALRLGRFLEEE